MGLLLAVACNDSGPGGTGDGDSLSAGEGASEGIDPDDDEGDMLPEMSPDEWAARYVTPN